MHSIKCFSAVPVGDNRQIGITIENVTQFKHSTTWLARTTSNMNAPDKVGPTLKVAKPLQLTNEATNAWTLMVTHIITMKYEIYSNIVQPGWQEPHIQHESVETSLN